MVLCCTHENVTHSRGESELELELEPELYKIAVSRYVHRVICRGDVLNLGRRADVRHPSGTRKRDFAKFNGIYQMTRAQSPHPPLPSLFFREGFLLLLRFSPSRSPHLTRHGVMKYLNLLELLTLKLGGMEGFFAVGEDWVPIWPRAKTITHARSLSCVPN